MFISDYNVLWKRSLVMIIVFLNSLIIIKIVRRVKRSEESLHESREIFRSVFDNSAAGIAIADRQGRFIRVNESFSAITGYPVNDVLELNFRDITHPEDIDADLLQLRKLENNEIREFSMEKRYLHRNGNYIWIFLTVSAIRNTAGEIQYFVAHIQNIANREEASFIDLTEREKALFEKNRAFQEIDQIYNTVGIGLCLVNMDRNIARINDSFLRIFHREREEVIGRKCHEIMHESICMSSDCPLERIMSGENNCEFEAIKVVEGNKALSLIVTANPFRSPDGETRGIILSFTDISEYRMLEKKIAEISEQERQNLGQLLHDELGQLLTGLTFRAEALKSAAKVKQCEEVGDIEEITSLIKKVHLHVRRIMIGLYPSDVKHDRLLVALKDLAAETERLYDKDCIVISNGEFSVTNHSDITQLLYIAKESVHNAVKHTTTGKILISLNGGNGMFSMMVQNEGSARRDTHDLKSGLGMRIMKYRAKLIGAKFEAGFERGKFIVRVSKALK